MWESNKWFRWRLCLECRAFPWLLLSSISRKRAYECQAQRDTKRVEDQRPGPLRRGATWGDLTAVPSTRPDEYVNGFAWEIDGNEVRLGIEIVLARFVHDANVAVFACGLIEKHLVDLASLQVFAVPVVNTEGETRVRGLRCHFF